MIRAGRDAFGCTVAGSCTQPERAISHQSGVWWSERQPAGVVDGADEISHGRAMARLGLPALSLGFPLDRLSWIILSPTLPQKRYFIQA